MADEATIRAMIDDWTSALRAKDAASVAAHHGPEVVHFSLAPPLAAEGDAEKGLQAWFATWDGPLGYEFRIQQIEAGGDVGFVSGLARMSGAQGGRATDLWFRLTLGLRRIGGAWKIVHEHESTPFYMDGSFKAALDLRP